MKRIALAALAACLLGGGAAAAYPVHGGPGGFHGGSVGVHHGPVGFHPGPIGFHPVPIGYHHGPVWVGGYRHWGYGAYLPAAWLVPDRFIVDFADFGLAPPPADFEWVRNGPDALLVNLDTGMVVQVVPNAFA